MGVTAAPEDLLRGWLEGFSVYDGPDTSVLEKEYDYSHKYQGNKASFVEPAREFSGKLSRPLKVFSYHNGTDLDAKERSAVWWAPITEGNGLHTVESVKDHFALLTKWGERTHVSVAEIPAGVDVKFLYGRAKPFGDDKTAEIRPGGGVQYSFERFNSDWIKDTKPLPK